MSGIIKKDWDSYWADVHENKGIYAIIANFYRKFIISKAVKYYFHKYYNDNQGSIYLHAGCGSGESDFRINFQHALFIHIDKSFEALNIAKKKAKFKNIYFVCADILQLPFRQKLFDGIWNVGVMEHFYENDIIIILKEFNRVLKRQAKFIIFWPPAYGLSVIALSIFIFVMNGIFRKSLSLHPEEMSKIKSKKWAHALFKQANLHITKTHFSIRDFFTHVILVGNEINRN